MTNNFDAIHVDANAATPEEESFAAMFEASLESTTDLSNGTIVKGIVVSVDKENVTLDIGTKAEAVVAISEFVTVGEVIPAVGAEVSAMAIYSDGRTRLSVLDAHKAIFWDKIEAALQDSAYIDATFVKETKGGFQLSIGGVRAFMPRSESGHGDMGDASFPVAIIEATRRPENVVVSRKRSQEAADSAKREAFFAKVSVGDKLSGVVKRLTDYGAFVDVGGMDGLLHVSDMAWRRFDRPSEILNVGQTVNVEVIGLDAKQGKISLSMKSLQEDPWVKAATTYEPGMRVTGTVRRLLKFGAVVEVEPGVEGMIHVSEMTWTQRNVQPSQVVAEGDVVDVAVLSVEPEERRMALSLRAVSENPWQAWLAAHPAGSKVTGKIRNIKEFGFFVGLADDMDGMVHVGDLSWDEQGGEAIKQYQKGQEVECTVLGVDVNKQRIALGIKQLSSDPFELFVKGAKRGGVVRGTVISVEKNAAIVEVAPGVTAYLAFREMPKDAPELKVGDEIEAKITDINSKYRKVNLSVNQFLRDEERDAVKHYSKKMQEKEQPSALALALEKLKQ